MTDDQIASIQRKLDEISQTMIQVPLLAARVEALASVVSALQTAERQDRDESHKRSLALARLDERQAATDRRIGRVEYLTWAVLGAVISSAALQILPWGGAQ